MQLKATIFLVSMLCLIGCASKTTVLYPLTGTDIYDGKNKGDVCFSEFYLNEVAQIKIGKK